MTADTVSRLYTPEILALAVDLADCPYDPNAPIRGDIRSRSCGSSLAISLETDESGAVVEVGLRVLACAIGQASAAIFARDIKGRTRDDIKRQEEALASWLNRSDGPPQWAGIEALDPARAYPGRHEAILMPWRAALEALSKGSL